MAATGPAWQVRESARQKLLEAIKGKAYLIEEDLEKHSVPRGSWPSSFKPANFWVLLHEKLMGTIGGEEKPKSNTILILIHGWSHEQTNLYVAFTKEFQREIKGFSRSPEEARALYAELFVWTTERLVAPARSALRRQEVENPRLIYQVDDAVDHVPLE